MSFELDGEALRLMVEKRMDTDKDFKDAILGEFGKMVTKEFAKDAFTAYANDAGGLKMVSEADIMASPAPQWIVEGLIQESTICGWAGPGGIGKTFHLIALTRAVASGTPFFGREVKQGRILYVAAEGVSAFGERIRAWNDAHGVTVPADAITYVTSGVNLSDAASVDALCETIRQGEYSLIVLDTFSQLSYIENENDAASTAKVYRNVKRLRDAHEGSAVIVVHHTNAGNTKARGSTVHKDNVDTLVMVSGTSESFNLSTRIEDGGKVKDGEPTVWEGFSLQPRLNSAVVVQDAGRRVSANWEPVAALLSDGEWHRGSAIREALDIKPNSADAKALTRDLNMWSVAAGPLEKTGPRSAPQFRSVPVPVPNPLLETL